MLKSIQKASSMHFTGHNQFHALASRARIDQQEHSWRHTCHVVWFALPGSVSFRSPTDSKTPIRELCERGKSIMKDQTQSICISDLLTLPKSADTARPLSAGNETAAAAVSTLQQATMTTKRVRRMITFPSQLRYMQSRAQISCTHCCCSALLRCCCI